MKEDSQYIGINEKGHLDENSLAVCAEWLSGSIKMLPPELKEHLDNCDHCKQEVLEISEIIDSDGTIEYKSDEIRDKFEETCAAKYSPSIQTVNKTQFLRVAAILIILIAMTSLVVFIGPNREIEKIGGNLPEDSLIDLPKDGYDNGQANSDSNQSEESKQEVIIESVEKNLYADNFIPNQGLEALIGAQFRAIGNPAILSPPKDTIVSRNESLKFTGNNPKGEILELQLLNNKGRKIESYGELKELDHIIKLEYPPGLYYWKLVGAEELYSVGKITIKEKVVE